MPQEDDQSWLEHWTRNLEVELIDFLCDPALVRSAMFRDPPRRNVMCPWIEFYLGVEDLFCDGKLDLARGHIRGDVRAVLAEIHRKIEAFKPRVDRIYSKGNDPALLDDPAWNRITADAIRLRAVVDKHGWEFERHE